MMHPMQRTQGEVKSHCDFSAHELENFAAARQLVLEFLFSNIFDSLFVKRDSEKLKLGDKDNQEQMASRQASFNVRASETLLNQVCDALFSGVSRYLDLKDRDGNEKFDESYYMCRLRYSRNSSSS